MCIRDSFADLLGINIFSSPEGWIWMLWEVLVRHAASLVMWLMTEILGRNGTPFKVNIEKTFQHRWNKAPSTNEKCGEASVLICTNGMGADKRGLIQIDSHRNHIVSSKYEWWLGCLTGNMILSTWRCFAGSKEASYNKSCWNMIVKFQPKDVFLLDVSKPVSYTHLDVYKRQD